MHFTVRVHVCITLSSDVSVMPCLALQQCRVVWMMVNHSMGGLTALCVRTFRAPNVITNFIECMIALLRPMNAGSGGRVYSLGCVWVVGEGGGERHRV